MDSTKYEKKSKRLFIVCGICIAANLLLLLYTFVLNSNIQLLEKQWVESTYIAKDHADKYDRFLKSFAYEGFLKNYAKALVSQNLRATYIAKESLLKAQQDFLSLKGVLKLRDQLEMVYVIESILNKHEATLNNQINLLKQDVKLDNSQIIQILYEEELLYLSPVEQLGEAVHREFHLASEFHQKNIEKRRANVQAILLISQPTLLIAASLILVLYRRSDNALKEAQAIFEATPDAIIISNKDGKIIKYNSLAENLFGYTKSELKNLTIEDLVANDLSEKITHKILRDNYVEDIAGKILKNQTVSNNMVQVDNKNDLYALNKNNQQIPVNIKLTTYYYKNSLKIISSITDLSESKSLEAKAFIDPLTQIANRNLIDKKLKSELQRAKRYDRPFSVIFIDIDYFKRVNDSFGHLIGDRVLVEFASVLNNRIRKVDMVGRFGGEEFIVLSTETPLSEAVALAESLKSAIEHHEFPKALSMTASFGVAAYHPASDISENDLIQRADDALYKAKTLGRNQVVSH
ncbi:hypothetical protein MAH1_25890 [Sessilibacter sp. MAH1]